MKGKNLQKNQAEKPTEKQLKKVKKKLPPEKKEEWPYEIEKEKAKKEKETSKDTAGEEETSSLELEEICGNLWVVLYQLGGLLRKGFEPLTNDVKKLLSPPTARIALKYQIQDYMKDEFLLLGILGIDISKRLMVKKKDDKNDYREKRQGKDHPDA